MEKCKICGNFISRKEHKCPPIWIVTYEVSPINWRFATEIYAHDAEYAVEKYADELDAGNGERPKNRCVAVKRKGTEEILAFEITFDVSVTYYANEIKLEDL